MSNQGYKGWFPECLICDRGNLDGIVCLNSANHEDFYFEEITSLKSEEIDSDDHHWKLCEICDDKVISDPLSWGVYAICINCFNKFMEKSVVPPYSPMELINYVESGRLEIVIPDSEVVRWFEIRVP